MKVVPSFNRCLAACLLSLLLAEGYVLSATDVAGSIDANTTWSAASSPYNVTGNVTVAAGVTLSIEPGVQVVFNQFTAITVNGALSAIGSSGSPIVFDGSTSTPGWWGSINITNDGSATFEYCEIRNPGYFYAAGIYKNSSGSLVLRNSILADSSGAGLRLASGSSSVISENNQFEGNGIGARLGVDTSFSDTTSTFSNNGSAPVSADGGTHTTDVSWELSSDASLVIFDNHTVAEGATLTLSPGLVVKSAQFDGFIINGALVAEGTAEAPIYLTSYRDDSVGGDANNDGTATTASSGWWSGVDIRNTGSANFDHCTVAYSGYFNAAGIYMRSSGDLTLKNSQISGTGGSGLRLTSGYGSFLSENNQFVDNESGVRLGINTSFTDTTSSFTNNSFAPVSADGGTHTTDVSWELSSEYSIVISDSHTVAEGGSLTLQPGLVLKSTQFDGITVYGTFTADGTEAAPIYLTSHRDDTVGGDANNDASTTSPGSGWWSGIDVRNAGSATFDYCTVSYSGYFNAAGIYKRSTGSLSLTNSVLSHANGAGLRLNSGSSSLLSQDNQFDDNSIGVRLGIDTSFSDTTSSFSNNSYAPVSADGGTHTVDVSWELSSAYSIVIGSNQTVAQAATLTLMPGLVLKADQFTVIIIDGSLVAQGTAEAPIHLTSYRDDSVGGDTNNDGGDTDPSRGWWSGIDVRNNGFASFDFATVAYSGYFNAAGIYARGAGDFVLSNSIIKETDGSGLRLVPGYSSFLSQNNRFENNDLGVRVAINASFADTTSAFVGNRVSQVGADGGTLTENTAWNLSSHSSILIQENLTVGEGATLTLSPGLVVKFAQFDGLIVEGSLVAESSPGQPIVFTSSRDDSVGGDTNNDGGQSLPPKGWWSGLNVRNGGSLSMENGQLRYAGYFNAAGVRQSGSGDLSLKNSVLSEVAGSALYLLNATGNIEVVRCRFENSEEGIFVKDVVQAIGLVSCQYDGNSEYGVLNSNSGEVDARSSWWGDASGPWHPETNPNGLGDRVSDGVLFDPWRQTPGTVDILSPTRSGTIVVGDTLRFLGSALDSASAGYAWNFGDGRTSSNRNPGLVTYSEAGEFQIQFAVTNDGVPDPFPQGRDINVVVDSGEYPDLQALSLQVSDSLGIGQSATVTYTAQNQGPGAIPSTSWIDRIYLSRDSILDTRDTLLGSADQNRSLAVGESYSDSVSVTLPPVEQGPQYLLLSANDEWSLVELRRLNNERSESVTVLVPELQSGVAFDGSFGVGSTEQYFRIAAGGGENLLIDFQKIEPNLEVYIRFGQVPTRSDFDYRLDGGSLAIPAVSAGSWYILVYGEAIQKEGQFSLKFDAAEVAVTSVSPTLADAAAPLDLRLAGAGFTDPLSVSLIASNGAVFEASEVGVDAFESASASFGQGVLPVDSFDLRVQKGGDDFIVPDAVEVVSGGVPDFWVDINSPTPMGYHQLATIFVEYGNRGTAPMEAPMLVVTALQNDQPGALMTLDPTLLSSGFWTSAIPKGFSTSIRMLASGEQPGLIMPGETIRVPVYYAGWLKPWDFRYPPFEFKVVALTSDDQRQVPWSLLQPTLKPAEVDDDAWAAIWDNATSAIGSTVGDFVSMLSRNAVYLSKIGSEALDINALLSFEILKASGALSPLSALASSADLATSSGEINLWFTRSFPRDIANRYRLGPLGYGWSHPWDIALETMEDGTVVIKSGNGSQSAYQPDSRKRNSYFSGKGDGSTLVRSGDSFTLTRRDGGKQVFNANGQFVRSEDRNGNSISLQYENSRLSNLTHSNGRSIELRYNASGLVSEVEDSLGRVVAYGYDAGKHLVSYTDSSGRVTEYDYSASQDLQQQHALTEIRHPGDQVESFSYDSLGRVASQVTGSGSSSFTYNQGDIQETAATGETTTLSFNHLGMLSRVVDGESGVTSFSYDEGLNNSLIRSPDGTSIRISHDRDGVISEVTNQNGDTWTYETGVFGLATRITSPEGKTQSMEYDSSGNLTKLTYPNGLFDSFSYDSNGNRTELVNAKGITETTTYNNLGLPLTKTYSDGSSRSFEYDAQGRLIAATNGEGTTSFEYDSDGYLTKITYPTDLFIEYAYDGQGRIVASNDHNGLTNRYIYNAEGLLESLRDAGDSELVGYTYDDQGLVSEKRYGTGARTTYAYNGKGQVTLQKTYDDSEILVAEYAIEHNAAGLPITYRTPDGVFTYAYDQAGRLAETVFEPVSEAAVATSFQRDKDGHLVKMNLDGEETLFSTNELGRYTTVGDTSVEYDALGNVISRNVGGEVSTYVYDAVGNVVEMQTSGGNYTMRYDALGTPLGLSAPDLSVDYVYDRIGTQSLFGEYDMAGGALRTYQHGRELSVVHYGGDSYFPVYDPLKGGTALALPTDVVTSEPTGIAPLSFQSYLPFGIPWAYDDPNIPVPQFYGRVLEGYLTLAEQSYNLGGQAYEWGVDQGGVDRTLGALLRNQTFSNVTGGIGQAYEFLGDLDDLNQYLGRVTNIRIAIEGAPQWFQRGANWLGGDGPNNFLGNLGHIANGIKVIDGLSETWSENRSVDILDVLNPFGSTNRGEAKIRDGLASTALTLLGTAAAGTAAAPVAVAAGLVAFVSGITGGLQEDFWIWWDDLDVTGERLQGSAMSGSRDPNQKLGVSGYGPENYVSSDRRLTYRIDFENDPSATSPAQVVTIRDQLPDEVDWASFEIVEVGFGDISIPVEPGTRFIEKSVEYEYGDSEYEFEVEVRVEVSIEEGEIFAIFYTLDPESGLPPPVDVGFLPPEIEEDDDLETYQEGEGRGQGYLTYAVYPKADLPTGTEIRNVATIQFDFSFDIDTNQVDPLDASKGTDPDKEALVTIDSDIPSAAVDVLPDLSLSRFNVGWSGQSASGIRSFDVYVRASGGEWTPWLTDTTRTSANFDGVLDESYEFYAVGTSNVGIQAPYAPEAQASTLAGIADPSIVIAESEDGKLEVSWIAVNGCEYQIQYSSDLRIWTDLGERQSAVESVEILTVKDEDYDFEADRFYRIAIYKL